MSVSFWVAALGAFVSVIFTGLLVSRSTRAPRADLAALLFASAGLTAALVAQAAGYRGGFGAITFRTIQIGGQFLAPVGLVWALAEMAGRSIGARFVSRLGLAALAVVAGVILAIDPLSGTAFGMGWPAASVYYLTPAHAVLLFIEAVTALSAVVALVTAGMRARRDHGWREIFGIVVPVAVAALATIGVRVKLPAPAYAGICLFAVVLTWFAGKRASELPLDELQAGVEPPWDGRESGYAPMGHNTGYDPYNDDTGGFRRGDTDFSGWYRADSGGFAAAGAGPAHGYGGPDTDYGRGDFDPGTANGRGGFETGDVLPAAEAYSQPAAESAAEPVDTSRLYGQIAIYTLLEEQVGEFDRLAEDVVEKVSAHEPDTLVYVMHGVPSAPMQRILYEVYRDESAFEEHNRQPHVRDFEDARKPYVLATNVIQLGVRYAMFARAGALPAATSIARPGAPPGPLALPAGPSAGMARAGAPAAGSSLPGSAVQRPSMPSAEQPPAAAAVPRSGSASSRPGVSPARTAYPSGSSGGSYPGGSPGGSYPDGSAEGSYPGGPSAGSYRGGRSGDSYPGGPSAGSYRGGRSADSYPGGQSAGSYRGGRSGDSYPGGPAGDSYQGATSGSSYQRGQSGDSYPGGSAGSSRQPGAASDRPGFPGGPPAGSYPGGAAGGTSRPDAVPPGSAYPGEGSYPDSTPAGPNRPPGSAGGTAGGAPPWHDQPRPGKRRPAADDDDRPWESKWPPARQ